MMKIAFFVNFREILVVSAVCDVFVVKKKRAEKKKVNSHVSNQRHHTKGTTSTSETQVILLVKHDSLHSCQKKLVFHKFVILSAQSAYSVSQDFGSELVLGLGLWL